LLRYWLSIAIAAALSPSLANSALAQSGATGGTLGKTGKSVSGAAVIKKAPPAKRSNEAARQSTAAPATNGTWHWTARCGLSGTWTGTFRIRGDANQLSGQFALDQPGDDGEIVGGFIDGKRVEIRRKIVVPIGGTLVQVWNGTILGSSMSGVATHTFEKCSFSASL